MQVSTVNPTVDAVSDGLQLVRYITMEQTHVFDLNLQKELLSEYEVIPRASPKSTPSSL